VNTSPATPHVEVEMLRRQLADAKCANTRLREEIEVLRGDLTDCARALCEFVFHDQVPQDVVEEVRAKVIGRRQPQPDTAAGRPAGVPA